MTELTSVPEGYEWGEKESFFWRLRIIGGPTVAYVDDESDVGVGYRTVQVLDGVEIPMVAFESSEEAKHYCHMLILTGAA